MQTLVKLNLLLIVGCEIGFIKPCTDIIIAGFESINTRRVHYIPIVYTRAFTHTVRVL